MKYILAALFMFALSAPALAQGRATVCDNPGQTVQQYLNDAMSQDQIWSGLAYGNTTIKIYQGDGGDWTVTVQSGDKPECEYSWGTLGVKVPLSGPSLESRLLQ